MNVEAPTYAPPVEPVRPADNAFVLPEAFIERLKAERPDGLNWDRIDEAVAILKKPPEPEPTEWQKFFREMYQTGDKSPYKVKRGPIKFDAWKVAIKEEFTNPVAFIKHAGDHVMAIDKDFRGGVEIGDMKTRATRAVVMVGNMVPNIALDIVTSLPPNLLEKATVDHLRKDLSKAQDAAKVDKQSQKEGILAQAVASQKMETVADEKIPKEVEELIEKIQIPPKLQESINALTGQIGGVKLFWRMTEVMNDKNVTAFGNTIQRHLTGEKGWFTSEASDKLNDLLTAAFKDVAEDFLNGPTIESLFRIAYQVPVFGALFEQVWTRWSNFQSYNEYTKGNLKGAYAGIGAAIGYMRDVDNKTNYTPSHWLTNKTWDGGKWLVQRIGGIKGKDVPAV